MLKAMYTGLCKVKEYDKCWIYKNISTEQQTENLSQRVIHPWLIFSFWILYFAVFVGHDLYSLGLCFVNQFDALK